jgi:hypothetical protein
VPRLFAHGLLLALLPSVGLGAELGGGARLWLGGGFDGNARRDFQQVGRSEDGFFGLTGTLSGRAAGERLGAAGTYEGGLRTFFRHPTEDVLVQAASVSGALSLGSRWTLGLDGRGRDRRGASRDYSDLLGQLSLSFTPDAAVDARVTWGARRFLYWPAFGYSFGASELGATAGYRFDRRHSAHAFGELGGRSYRQPSRAAPGDEAEGEPPLRRDTAFIAGVGYTYRGKVAVSAGYTYAGLASNSFGESSFRHRVNATLGLRLPYRLMLFTQLGLQLTRYPDGVFLSPELSLLEDEENHNSVALKLVRPLTRTVEVELRYALYQNTLRENGLSYFRQLAAAGLTWRI